jgi:hypothetical protein
VPGLSDLERRCAAPFSLLMMRLNALIYDIPHGTLHKAARETTDDEVAQLPRSDWRPRVMGARLASGRVLLPDAVLPESAETSAGSLTAPRFVPFYGGGMDAAAV